ncbi:MAG TPA: flagellar hook capping FlgD N-terminal domain-containing protein [Terracidiphilus sp.]
MASPPADSNSTGSDSAVISANDFLTLLVTEMQNQDPTAATDPNEYINQLVNVNSLQQLISINQTLTSSLGSSGSAPAGSARSATPAAATASADALAIPSMGSAATEAAAGTTASAHALPANAPGNLSIPAALPAAQRIAQSLAGR